MIYKINVTTANKDHELHSYDEYQDFNLAQSSLAQTLKSAKANGFKEVNRHKYKGSKMFYDEYRLQSDKERMEVVFYSSNRTA